MSISTNKDRIIKLFGTKRDDLPVQIANQNNKNKSLRGPSDLVSTFALVSYGIRVILSSYIFAIA